MREHGTELRDELFSVAEQCRPAVAIVRVGGSQQRSTGVLVRADLVAATAHAVTHAHSLRVSFEGARSSEVNHVQIHPRWTVTRGAFWNVALLRIDPVFDRDVVRAATNYDIFDPVVVLGYRAKDEKMSAQLGTIDAIVMDRGAEIVLVSGLTKEAGYGAPAFDSSGGVVGIVSGDLVDPRNARDLGTGSGVAAIVPVGAIVELVQSA